MRPRKFYVIWELGAVRRIVEGRPRNYAGPAFRTRLDAEEFAAWWELSKSRLDERNRERDREDREHRAQRKLEA